MLMIGTTELAKVCYAAWRAYEQLHGHEMARVRSYYAMIEMHRTMVWDHLSNREQQQWRQVAMSAAQIMTEAFGATEVTPPADPCEEWEMIHVAPSSDESGVTDVENMRAAIGDIAQTERTGQHTCDTGELD
jgi:hypothetical protein